MKKYMLFSVLTMVLILGMSSIALAATAEPANWDTLKYDTAAEPDEEAIIYFVPSNGARAITIAGTMDVKAVGNRIIRMSGEIWVAGAYFLNIDCVGTVDFSNGSEKALPIKASYTLLQTIQLYPFILDYTNCTPGLKCHFATLTGACRIHVLGIAQDGVLFASKYCDQIVY